MKPTHQLISALRSAAVKITSPDSSYSWDHKEKCNCGLLAQELGVSANDINLLRLGSWQNNASKYFCSQTNLPLHIVFRTLLQYGLEKQDFQMIESQVPGGSKDPKAVANQFQIWAHELEQQLNQPAKVLQAA